MMFVRMDADRDISGLNLTTNLALQQIFGYDGADSIHRLPRIWLEDHLQNSEHLVWKQTRIPVFSPLFDDERLWTVNAERLCFFVLVLMCTRLVLIYQQRHPSLLYSAFDKTRFLGLFDNLFNNIVDNGLDTSEQRLVPFP